MPSPEIPSVSEPRGLFGRGGSLAVLAVAFLTLGSGLLNLYSVIGPSLHHRVELLRRFFPLEFVHLSRSFTLLTGFALVISSVNIYRRKRLAWWIASALAVLSIVFHVMKGLDYEEATLSMVLLVMLAGTRSHFTVRGRTIQWREAILGAAVALVLALAYGVAGFWLLDPREFGLNFHWHQAFEATVNHLLLKGDPRLTPHTHHAAWFLESLHLITFSAFIYAGISLFRPALYRFRTRLPEKEHARQIVIAHGRTALDFFKVRDDKSFFFSEDGTCFLAYRVASGFAIVLGDPVGPEERIEAILCQFSAYCYDNGWGLGFHQTLPDFLDVYRRLGFKQLKVGDDAVVNLGEFSLEGKTGKSLRSKVKNLEKEGVTSEYYPAPVPRQVVAEVKEVSDQWLQIPGRHERQFTLGMFEESYVSATPVFAARDAAGTMLAFVNIVPSFRRGEATIDLMRRRANSPNGIMEYTFAKLLLHNKEMGFERFTLGMAPMAGFQHGEPSSPEERAIHQLFQHLNFLFSFKGIRAFKAKFATTWEPRYVIYRNVFDLPRLAMALARITKLDD